MDEIKIGKKIGKLEKEIKGLKSKLLDGWTVIITKVENGYILNFTNGEYPGKKVIQEKNIEYAEKEALRETFYELIEYFRENFSKHNKSNIKIVFEPGSSYSIKKEDKKDLEEINIWKDPED